ncbi:lipopolysaccharide biosynthesis protein [Plantibacter sp. T3]|uniref:lipopolysaccharide biosynthesis protein n=1 Tax=Plantibacter sp. T3 TaxID=2653161 RepID=UPI0012F3105F|nr:polysaccharide biosynthesis C-terminal domain-containing protein [Plantibacter sp. T3]VXC53396.1 putative O-antigen/teichoic acid export membrane protein [Plantibacter sp. T3]
MKFPKLVSRVFGFSSSAAILALLSLVSIPALISELGTTAWSGLAVGQAIGVVGSIAVAWGWGVVGPASIARREAESQRRYYESSLVPRLILLIPASMAIAGIAWLLPLADHAASFLQALAIASYGAASPWYFIGRGMPKQMFLVDTLPRVLVTLAGIAFLYLGADARIYAGLQLAGTIAVVVLTHLAIVGTQRKPAATASAGLRRMTFRLRRQVPALSTAAVAASYLALPLIVMPTISPAAVAPFAMSDRFLKWTVTAITPVTQVLQGWIPARDGNFRSRALPALHFSTLFGLACGSTVTFVAPFLSSLLSHNQIQLSLWATAGVGLMIWMTVISRVVSSAILIPLGGVRAVLHSALVGAAVGLLLLVPATLTFGYVGATWSIAVAEVCVTTYQLLAMRTLTRKVWR